MYLLEICGSCLGQNSERNNYSLRLATSTDGVAPSACSVSAASTASGNLRSIPFSFPCISTGANSHRRPNKENRSTYLTEKV